jgi:diguanylate cyclase (GGDEF)-like protein
MVSVKLFERRPARLDVFMLATTVAALPALVGSTETLGQLPGQPQLALACALAAGVVLGELYPIEVARRGRHSDEITVSTALALALALVAPIGWALIAQSIPLVVDDLRRGKHWSRPVFNVGQYALTFVAARAVFDVLSHAGGREAVSITPQDIPAVFAAGAVYFVVNQLLVGTAVALSTGIRLRDQLREDWLFQLGTSGLLVCLTPVILAVAQFSLVLAPVLLLPLLAVRSSARMALQRHHDALHDSLTGLPNRAYLRDDLERRLAAWSETGPQDRDGLAVLLLDVDHFKEINDTLGHLAGDHLIVEVASRLLEATSLQNGRALGSFGAGPAMVARLGGDEFAVLSVLSGTPSTWRDQIAALAETIRLTLGQAVVLADVRLAVEASLGVAIAPWHGATVDELLAKADVAMYAAKKQRSGWLIYESELDTHSPERLALLGELRDGIDAGQLVLAYQPQCDTQTRQVHSVEALVRWQHPSRGLLSPCHFIDIAESTGMITELTMDVLEQAVRQAGAWRDAGRPLAVAVNLSARLLTDLQLPEAVERILAAHNLPGELLTLEVTESTIMNDPSRAITICRSLRALGVRLAIDDYGTGYSSLSYLCQLDADELKIDKSFIQRLVDDGEVSGELGGHGEALIVRSTIELAHSLGMSVIAEGVENDHVWRELERLGCDHVQGYALTQPLLAPAFEAWLTQREPPPTPAEDLPRQRFREEMLPSC